MAEDDSTNTSNSKLSSVFNKLTTSWPKNANLTTQKSKIMTSDIIETVLTDSAIPVAGCAWEHTLNAASENNNSGESSVMRSACAALAKRLESELRAAKSAQLACGEVLLPADLLPRVARAVLYLADSEPCGLRGCTLFVNFETEAVCRRLCTIKCDPGTVSTFELFLTLKQDATSWHNLLPQFLKNLTRGGTVMISPAFTLSKKKLYRSYQQFSSTD